MNQLRIIFIGTPEFAVESLKCLVEASKNVVAVITAPDRKAGRGRKVNESAVKQFARDNQIPILQPTNLKNKDFLEELKSFQADLQIVVAFRMLPEAVWNMPRYGTFNLHASLLPNYRGAAPINWAIINGEKITGVTTFFLKHKIDTGDIIFQEKVEITEDDTAGSLHDKLMIVGSKLVVKTVNAIEEDDIHLIKQEALISLKPKEAPKIFKEDCRINWNMKASEICNFIRGLSPYPAAWTSLKSLNSDNSLSLKIYTAKIAIDELTIKVADIQIKERKILIGTLDQVLEVEELQLEGKRRMSAKELLNGFDIQQYKAL